MKYTIKMICTRCGKMKKQPIGFIKGLIPVKSKMMTYEVVSSNGFRITCYCPEEYCSEIDNHGKVQWNKGDNMHRVNSMFIISQDAVNMLLAKIV